jgi:hypothetical protein
MRSPALPNGRQAGQAISKKPTSTNSIASTARRRQQATNRQQVYLPRPAPLAERDTWRPLGDVVADLLDRLAAEMEV